MKTEIEEAAKCIYPPFDYDPEQPLIRRLAFKHGAEWMQERMYSEDEVREIMAEAWNSCEDNEGDTFTQTTKRILEQYKKQKQ